MLKCHHSLTPFSPMVKVGDEPEKDMTEWHVNLDLVYVNMPLPRY